MWPWGKKKRIADRKWKKLGNTKNIPQQKKSREENVLPYKKKGEGYRPAK